MRMNQRVHNIICTVIVLGLIIYGIDKLGYLVRPTDTDGAYSQIKTFHSLPDNSLEVIVYGSSHAFRGVNTMEMYNKYGIGSYNYGWHWQKINTTKAFLKDSLKTQSPKVALIEAYLAGEPLLNTNVTPETYYCNYLFDKEAKREYMKRCQGNNPSLERRLSYVIPLTMFHDNWTSLNQASFSKSSKLPSQYLLENMGFSTSETKTEVSIPLERTVQQKEFNKEALYELNDIIETCKEHGTEVVFFTVPWQGEYEYHDAMSEFARKNDCPYIDFFDLYEQVAFDSASDYSDYGHLNSFGAIKVADYLGEFLVENYELTDFREVENNLWSR